MKSNITQNHETLTEKQLKASQDIELTPDALETVSGGVDATPAFCKHCGARLINYYCCYEMYDCPVHGTLTWDEIIFQK